MDSASAAAERLGPCVAWQRACARRAATLAALEARLAEKWDKDVKTLTARREAFDAAAAAAAADLARI